MNMTTNNILSKIMLFTAGAAIGSAVTWKLVKTKYERIARKEIDSVKEVYASRMGECGNTEVNADAPDEYYESDKPKITSSNHEQRIKELEEVREKLIQNEYTTQSDIETEKEGDDMLDPYVIPPDEVGDCDYDIEILTYYEGDGVLTDDYDEVIENIDETVGDDYAAHFGEYEQDTVFIRNDRLQIDYEIQRDTRSFSEI